MELSDVVAGSIPEASRTVLDLIERMHSKNAPETAEARSSVLLTA